MLTTAKSKTSPMYTVKACKYWKIKQTHEIFNQRTYMLWNVKTRKKSATTIIKCRQSKMTILEMTTSILRFYSKFLQMQHFVFDNFSPYFKFNNSIKLISAAHLFNTTL